ncbi:MAG: hypothetical protein ABI609_18210 [Acidobacteriota bacterium]
MRPIRTLLLALTASLAFAGGASAARPYPILFVTQPPFPGDFTSMNAVFGNQHPDLQSSNRGGDLWVLYPNDHLKNLTATAGRGVSGFQGATSIAVREPSVSWDGTKALFSMVVGAPSQQFQVQTYYWQIYEVIGLGEGDPVTINRVPHQPVNYNNVSPLYGTDGRILFTSDRPRDGMSHLYPQLDEYESAPTVTGVWSLDPTTGDLHLLNHTVSGVFSPSIDSSGRLVFIRWDHLQRDQQADADHTQPVGAGQNGTFNYVDETAASAFANTRNEVFPEPRTPRTDLLATMPGVEGQEFNQFFPWAMNEDGTNEETVNHLGRHDFAGYFDRAFTNDANIVEFIPPGVIGRQNANPLVNFIQMRESPTAAGRFFGVDAPEFGTHAAGQIVSFDAALGARADQVLVTYWTHRDTSFATPPAGQPTPNQSGMYRNPLPLSDGTVVVSHSPYTFGDSNSGSTANPVSHYDFRLKALNLVAGGGSLAGARLIPAGISKTLSYFDPDALVSYSGPLWELDPVEIKARTKPTTTAFALDPVEQGVFTAAGVSLPAFRTWLKARDLALIVTRNVTTRDAFDFQQPFNLRVLNTTTQTVHGPGTIYDVAHLQIVQADQIRGMGGMVNPRPGRRPIAQFLHEPSVQNPPDASGPPGSVAVASDGSIAAFVPAHRAVSWQLTDGNGKPVVHERYWLTMQPGEIRTCTSCHGMSHFDQAGNLPPTNPPQALANLLQYWQANLVTTPPAGEGFFAVAPCRLLDTRKPDGAAGGPFLDGLGTRTLLAGTRCGIPGNAKALSFNVTVTGASTAGNLVMYAGDDAVQPNTSTISFGAGTTRANNSVLKLSADGAATLKIHNNGASALHVIVDVNGYFQ